MKKILIVLATMLVGMTAMAQIFDGWNYEIVKADELRGTKEHVIFTYINQEDEVFLSYESDTVKHIMICTTEGIFDYEGEKVYGVLIGYYKEGKMCEKVTLNADRSDGDTIHIVGEKATKMIKWLESGGDIRIIVPRYNRSDLDVTIPHRI